MRTSLSSRKVPLDFPTLSKKDSVFFSSLLYFEIFDFPLMEEEIWQFSAFESREEFQECLNKWTGQGSVLREGEYFMLNWRHNKVLERRAAERRVHGMWPQGLRKAQFIQSFPFIEAVFISGSISKGVVATDGDVDFFIITKPGRLWFSRTLLALYKKIFLMGSHKYFCINYFIDSSHLSIEEQNRFTATEMATLIPVAGRQELINDFFKSNPWVNDYYPNYRVRMLWLSSGRNRWKPLMEKVLVLMGAAVFERLGFWLTTSFWKFKFRRMRLEDFRIALKSNKHVSKHHPLQFQKYVLTSFAAKVLEFEEKYGLKLDI